MDVFEGTHKTFFKKFQLQFLKTYIRKIKLAYQIQDNKAQGKDKEKSESTYIYLKSY